MNIPYFMEADESKATEQVQENRSEAEMAQKEYQELQNKRTSQ